MKNKKITLLSTFTILLLSLEVVAFENSKNKTENLLQNKSPVLKKVTGRLDKGTQGVMKTCNVTKVDDVSKKQMATLIEMAEKEPKGVLYRHIVPQSPSYEFVAFIDVGGQSTKKVELLRDHKSGIGRAGPASQALIDMISESCQI